MCAMMNSCHYSAWETDIDCQDDYAANLAELKKIETGLASDAFAVALITDIHVDLTDTVRVVDRINQRDDVAFVLVLGDITDFGLAAEFEWVCKALSSLDVPRFYVIGNHDSISFGKQIFSEHFAPFDYAFSFKDVKFILYNDNAFEFPAVPDYAFLADAVAVQTGETRRLTLAVSHIPPVKDAHTEQEAATLREFLFNQGIGLTLHGHMHEFDYWSDEFGVSHHITAKVKDGRYSMLFIDELGQASLQNCTATCTEAVLTN